MSARDVGATVRTDEWPWSAEQEAAIRASRPVALGSSSERGLGAGSSRASAPIASAARGKLVEYDKALHPPALNDQVEVVLWSRRQLGRVVVRDPAAKHHPPSHCEARQRRTGSGGSCIGMEAAG